MNFYEAIMGDREEIYLVCECNNPIRVDIKTAKEWNSVLETGIIPENFPVDWMGGFCLECGTPVMELIIDK